MGFEAIKQWNRMVRYSQNVDASELRVLCVSVVKFRTDG